MPLPFDIGAVMDFIGIWAGRISLIAVGFITSQLGNFILGIGRGIVNKLWGHRVKDVGEKVVDSMDKASAEALESIVPSRNPFRRIGKAAVKHGKWDDKP